MVKKMMQFLIEKDPELGSAIEMELKRQQRNIELIASENFVIEAVLVAAGTVLTNKYAEGYSGRRYYGGCQYVDIVETLAVERAKKLFNCKFANVQPHSGSNANQAVYLAFCKPGDTVLGMSLDDGGHLTHGSPFNQSGKHYNIVAYGLDPKTQTIDYEAMRHIALEYKPKMIIAGASAYPRAIDFKKFREVADEVGSYLLVDMAHIAGLVAAGEHLSPLPYAHAVTSTTHKTLRGPRGGLILTNDEAVAKKLNSAVFPGTQGGPLEHIIAAKAVAFAEALKPEFKEYQHRIILNARALAKGLLDRGFDLVSGGTDTHLLLVDLRKFGITGKEMEERLDHVYITVNKNMIPGDPQPPMLTSGIRIGTSAVTTRGFDEKDMDKVAELIYLAAKDINNEERIRKEVEGLCSRYPLYEELL